MGRSGLTTRTLVRIPRSLSRKFTDRVARARARQSLTQQSGAWHGLLATAPTTTVARASDAKVLYGLRSAGLPRVCIRETDGFTDATLALTTSRMTLVVGDNPHPSPCQLTRKDRHRCGLEVNWLFHTLGTLIASSLAWSTKY